MSAALHTKVTNVIFSVQRRMGVSGKVYKARDSGAKGMGLRSRVAGYP